MENMNSYQIRIGKTTYIVCVKQAETAKKPLETGHYLTSAGVRPWAAFLPLRK